MSPGADAVPGDEKPAECLGVNGLDLLPQLCERTPAKAAQYVGVDPFALGPARPELAFDELSRRGQLQDEPGCDADAKPIPAPPARAP